MSSRRQVILVKHAMPVLDPAVPARRWRLSDAGRADCARLSRLLAGYGPRSIASSTEPKAVETAQILGTSLGIDVTEHVGLGETDRTGVPLMPAADFEAAVERYFASPALPVCGPESADQAHRRFVEAVTDVVAQAPDGPVVVVAHGTVLSLLVSRANELDPFELWRGLGLPSFCLVDWPDSLLRELVGDLSRVVDAQ